FPNNDRPGVMLTSAAQIYLHRYAVTVGRSVVLATNNDSAYAVAFDLQKAGVRVAGILDTRAEPGDAARSAIASGLPVPLACAPTDTRGAYGIRAVEFHRGDMQGKALAGTRQALACDALLMSGGWNPTVHLLSQAGGGLRFDDR